jgi:hypothetical protein
MPALWPVDELPYLDKQLLDLRRENGFVPGTIGLIEWLEHAINLKSIWKVTKEPALWLVGAAASGVAGNYTYDAIKSFARRLSESVPVKPSSPGHLNVIALMAVRLRCAELNLPSPNFATFRVVGCRLWKLHWKPWAVWCVYVEGGDGDLEALVEVPDKVDLSAESILVEIRIKH